MSGDLVPGDQAFPDDKQLMADLSALNGQISRYVLRMLDADAKRTPPPSPDEELLFARTLRATAEQLEERAARRAVPDAPPALESDPAHRD